MQEKSVKGMTALLKDLYFWPLLETQQGKDIVDSILSEWQSLLNNKAATEAKYHTYLAEHAGS